MWSAVTISAAGDAASWIALVALALGPVHASLPLLVALYTAPVAAGGLVAAWALDRFDRRRLMIADSLVRGVTFGSIPVAATAGMLDSVDLYTVAATYGLLKMISLAGFPSLIPSLVSESQLDQANALEGASYGLASLAGAGLAGLAVTMFGPADVVALDAASYLVMALSLSTVRSPNPTPKARVTSAGQEPVKISAIVRFAVTHPVLRATTFMFALFNVGEGALLVLLPRRATQLGLPVGGYGYLVAASTGGELLAAAVLAIRPWRRPLPVSITLAQLAAGLLALALVFPVVISTVIVLVLIGIVSAAMTAWAQSLRMRLVPAAAHGRLFALLRTAMQATPPAGAALAAATLSHGAPATIFAVSLVMALPAILWAPDLLRRDRRDRT